MQGISIIAKVAQRLLKVTCLLAYFLRPLREVRGGRVLPSLVDLSDHL